MSDEERARLVVTSELWHDRAHIQRLIGAALYLARAEEREACARIAQAEDDAPRNLGEDCRSGWDAWRLSARRIAAAIRGRT